MKWIATALIWITGTLAYSQTAPQAPQDPYRMVTFTLKPNTPGPTWRLTSFGDGTGTFSYAEPQAQEQKLHFSPATVKRLAQGRATIETRHCETREKHIAKSGEKRIVLGLGPDALDCTFNYSDDAALEDAASAFLAVAETMQTGEKLAGLHRFDRLSLDLAMKTLVEESKDGRAIEIQNIAPTLQSIIDDDRVLQRVRREAAELLASGK